MATKMDDATLEQLRNSFKRVFNKRFPVSAKSSLLQRSQLIFICSAISNNYISQKVIWIQAK